MTVSDSRDLVAALLDVPGVAGAAVDSEGGAPGVLRLRLAAGADEVDVAGAVNQILRSRFGLTVDTDRVRVLDGPRRGEGFPTDAPAGAVATAAASAAAARTGPRADPPRSTGDAPAPSSGAQPSGADGNGDGRGANGTTLVADVGPVPGAPTPTGGRPTVEVSVETLAETDPGPGGTGTRLVIERVALVSARLGVTASVTLRSGGRAEVGQAEGAATSAAVHRSVAEAALRAVEALVDRQVRFAAEHVEIASTGEERTALVVVALVTERATQRLSGASVVRDDTRQAVIRAVLAAVNRRVGTMLAGVAG